MRRKTSHLSTLTAGLIGGLLVLMAAAPAAAQGVYLAPFGGQTYGAAATS